MFIIFLFIISFGSNAFGDDSFASKIETYDSISAVQSVQADAITSAKTQNLIQNLGRNYEININNKKNDNSNDGNLNKLFLNGNCQFEELLSYIYNQSFLHNKSKVLFSVNLSEIQPNAP